MAEGECGSRIMRIRVVCRVKGFLSFWIICLEMDDGIDSRAVVVLLRCLWVFCCLKTLRDIMHGMDTIYISNDFAFCAMCGFNIRAS